MPVFRKKGDLMNVHKHIAQKTFIDEVNEHTGKRIEDCYQCGKCTAGCPMATEADVPIHLLMRLVQLDNDASRQKALSSSFIWQCLSCETCSARCPKDCDPAGVVDALRELSLKNGLANKSEVDILNFHRFFLNSVKNNGRVFELALLMRYKIDASMHLRIKTAMQDAMLGLPMYMRGKINITPGRSKNPAEIKRIFKVLEEKSKKE